MLFGVEKIMTVYSLDIKNTEVNHSCWSSICDFKYMARNEVVQFAIQNTNLVERLIKICSILYTSDTKAQRERMVDYV